MYTITVWTIQSMQRIEWTRCVCLCTRFYWQSTKLPTGVYSELRLQPEPGLLEPEMY